MLSGAKHIWLSMRSICAMVKDNREGQRGATAEVSNTENKANTWMLSGGG